MKYLKPMDKDLVEQFNNTNPLFCMNFTCDIVVPPLTGLK